MDEEMNGEEIAISESNLKKVWIGVAVGAAIGLGIAFSRRKKKSRWDTARAIGKRMASKSNDLADTTRDVVDRVKTIYEESIKLIDEAGELWSHGRKLVGNR